jgi:DmsE family decaheme c-type cytochrome
LRGLISPAMPLGVCVALALVATLAPFETPALAQDKAGSDNAGRDFASAASPPNTDLANSRWHQAHKDLFKEAAYFTDATDIGPAGASPHAMSLAKQKRTKAKRARTAAAETPPKAKDEKSETGEKEEEKEPKHTAVTGPATYVGSEKCMSCHVSQGETFSKTTMGRIFLKNPRSEHEKLGCEACHGPGSIHVATGGREDEGGESIFTFDADSPRSIPERNERCLTCHESGARTHWKGSPHETRNLACTSCHQIMDKASPRNQLLKATEIETCTQCHKDRKAQLWRSSHMPVREGKLTCTSCHNPHGTANEKLLKEATVNETCYTCHADKRGPYLFEHAPARDNCLNCHEPHGSIHEKLLTVSRPRLCQQCHSEEDHPSEPHGPRELFAFNRGCANCHGGMQHGSNSPSGAQLHR